MGVAVEESVQCCSFYSLCNKTLELVKGTFKLQGVQMIIGHANKNFDLAFGGGGVDDYYLGNFVSVYNVIQYVGF